MFEEIKYLILPAEDGSRADTRIANEYSEEEQQAMISEGYVLVSAEDHSLLCGNGDREYCIAMDGSLYEKPPYVPTIEEVRDAKLQEIKNAYLEAVSAPAWLNQDCADPNGGEPTMRYVGYDTDQQSQIDFNSSFERAKLKGSTLYNIYVNPNNLKEKEFTYHTPEMFERALLAAGEYQEGVYAKYYTLKAKAEAAQTKEEIAEIEW